MHKHTIHYNIVTLTIKVIKLQIIFMLANSEYVKNENHGQSTKFGKEK